MPSGWAVRDTANICHEVGQQARALLAAKQNFLGTAKIYGDKLDAEQVKKVTEMFAAAQDTLYALEDDFEDLVRELAILIPSQEVRKS